MQSKEATVNYRRPSNRLDIGRYQSILHKSTFCSQCTKTNQAHQVICLVVTTSTGVLIWYSFSILYFHVSFEHNFEPSSYCKWSTGLIIPFCNWLRHNSNWFRPLAILHSETPIDFVKLQSISSNSNRFRQTPIDFVKFQLISSEDIKFDIIFSASQYCSLWPSHFAIL